MSKFQFCEDSFLAREEQLHEEAMTSTGLSDFGDPVYRKGLRQLLAARDASGIDYPHEGETILGPVRDLLVTRLKTLDRIRQAGPLPPIEAPIFVLGLPRTGTTAMQRLLMADQQMQGLEYWLGANPKPRPAREAWGSDEDFRSCQKAIAAMSAMAPNVTKLHPMAADEGEECRLVMEQSFGHSSFSLVAPLGTYQDWLFGADLVPHYQHFSRVLGLIGRSDQDRTWVLKCPHHAPQVENLLKAFPDARIILMHRPVEDLIPSVVRLADAFLALVEGPDIDMAARATLIVENIELTLQRLLKARSAHPDRIFDLGMDRFVADPLAAVEAIYARFGFGMTDESRAALTRWIAQNHGAGHGVPSSAPLPFGLDHDALRDRFRQYQG